MMELGRGGGTPRAGYLNPYQRLRVATYPKWLRQYIADLEQAVGHGVLTAPLPTGPIVVREDLTWFRKRALAVQQVANTILDRWGESPPQWLKAEPANVADLCALAMFCFDAELEDNDYVLVTVAEASPSCQELPLKLSREIDRRCPGERIIVQCEW